ncbi:MAG: site-specific integrase [Bacteroidota bacterium]
MTRTMISLLFIIRKSKALKNGEVPIYLRMTSRKQSVEIAIGRKINPELWSAEIGGAKGNTKEARDVNDQISEVKNQLRELMRQMREDGEEISPLALKNKWLGINPDEKTILTIFQEHNDKVKQLVGKDFANGTKQRYEVTFRHVKEFIKWKYKKEDLPLSGINHEFLTGMEFYLKTVRKCGHNSSIKYVKNFKKIVRIALASGWIKADPFVNYKMSLRKVDRGFLTEEELAAIQNKDFPCERLRQVRDIFLVGCMTGLAYSDLKKLTQDNLVKGDDGNLWIHVNRTKTDNPSHIPLLPIAAQIIDKYSNHPHCIAKNVLLPVSSNQRLNGYLKEIADVCEISKVLSTHIARHTFATTVTLNNDVPIESVSKMLGHSSINMTKVYARLLDKKVSSDMQKLFEKYSN